MSKPGELLGQILPSFALNAMDRAFDETAQRTVVVHIGKQSAPAANNAAARHFMCRKPVRRAYREAKNLLSGPFFRPDIHVKTKAKWFVTWRPVLQVRNISRVNAEKRQTHFFPIFWQ